MIKKILLIGLLLSNFISFGQQTPHYTQYMYNMHIINPAYAGARADLSIGILGRTQWVGVEGAPKTETFSINARAIDGIGLGLSVVHDKLGLSEETALYADVSYTLVMSKYSRLAVGLKGGLSFYNNGLANGITPDNEIYQSINGTYPNVGFGAFFYNKRFYAGLSIPTLLKTPKFRIDGANDVTGISEHVNVFATTGMVFDINDHLKYKPSLLVKYVSSLPLSVDLNSNFLYNNRFEVGVSYRYNDSVSGLFAIILNQQFRIGYTYDYTLSNLGKFNSGSHEIMLLFDIDYKKRGRWLKHSSCYF
jgi:type IX secretion system PorP/SprF family membrane protein